MVALDWRSDDRSSGNHEHLKVFAWEKNTWTRWHCHKVTSSASLKHTHMSLLHKTHESSFLLQTSFCSIYTLITIQNLEINNLSETALQSYENQSNVLKKEKKIFTFPFDFCLIRIHTWWVRTAECIRLSFVSTDWRSCRAPCQSACFQVINEKRSMVRVDQDLCIFISKIAFTVGSYKPPLSDCVSIPSLFWLR